MAFSRNPCYKAATKNTNNDSHMKLSFFPILMLITANIAYAEEVDKQFYGMKTIRCTYNSAVTTHFNFKGFEFPENGEEKLELTYDAIDFSKQSARLIGNEGAEDVVSTFGMLAVSFIEKTAVGGLNVTTVFPNKVTPSEYLSVNSRHMIFSLSKEKEGVVSQRHGTCKVLDYISYPARKGKK